MVVRNGYLPESTITTEVGDVAIQVPKVRDRSGSGVKFSSMLLPPYLKRASSVGELLPWLYLKGVSTGDFSEALSALLGTEAKVVPKAAEVVPKAQGKLKVQMDELWSLKLENHIGAIWMFIHDYNRRVREKLSEREEPVFSSVFY